MGLTSVAEYPPQHNSNSTTHGGLLFLDPKEPVETQEQSPTRSASGSLVARDYPEASVGFWGPPRRAKTHDPNNHDALKLYDPPSYVGDDPQSGGMRRLAHLDEYQHSSPVPLALFLMMFFIVGMVVLRFTRSSTEPKKRCRKALTMKTEGRNSRSL